MNRDILSRAIASMVPEIIRGVHLDFFVSRTITQTQFMVLLAVRSRGTCTMGDLARTMKVSMPTVTGIIERLVRLGYIKRVPKEEDRRRVCVAPTAKGEKFVLEFQGVVAQRWSKVLEAFNAGELEAFHRLILKLQGHLTRGA